VQATDLPTPATQDYTPPIPRAEVLAGWLRLQQTPGVGAVAGNALLEALKAPDRIFSATPDELHAALASVLAPPLANAAVQALRVAPPGLLDESDRLARETIAWLDQPDHALLTLDDPGYPAALRQIHGAPLLLYIKGRRALLAQASLAIVGSRNASAQGVANAEHFAVALSRAGLAIVSGLALGIDAAAHRGGLAGGGGTIAVIGTGIDRIYPARNGDLARRIAAEGCIVSEYALGTPPLPDNFPRRNRIISGLARGVLVVEAAAQSGSLITARYALHQGRDVFAIPGSIHSTLSKGCHQIIREGAKLAESVDDVLDEVLPGAPSQAGAGRAALALQLRAELETMLSALGHDPAGADALAARAGLTLADAQGHLLALELAGLIERLPGGMFQRIKP
jgi:DNA processing protein